MQSYRDRAIVVIFVLILGGGCLAQLGGLNPGGVSAEKQKLASRPDWRWDFPAYVRALDDWFRDNFRLRREFIFANSMIKLYVLHTSPHSEITLGQKGWQFYIGEHIPEYTRHVALWDETALGGLRREYLRRTRWLATRGAAHAILVAPNPLTIYPEFLPGWLTKPVHPQSILDQITEALRDNREIHFVDVRKRMWDAKAHHVLYRRLDSHWNDLGAYYAYACLMASLAQAVQGGPHQGWARGLEPLPLESFRVREVMVTAVGFPFMMGLDSMQSENIVLERDEQRFIQTDRPPRDYEDLTTWNDHATTPLRALVFRDSYFSNMVPLVSHHFRYVRYAWGPPFDDSIVVSERPDVVITQFVERRIPLSIEWPAGTQDVDALPPAPARASASPCS